MIRFENVAKVYDDTSSPALDNVDLEVERGDFVYLVGASGSGKSTFLQLVLREQKATAGRVLVAGKDVALLSSWKVPHLRRQMGAVFQDFRLLPNKTVYENVAFALEVLGRSRSQINATVPQTLEMVGLQGKHRRLPHELSGGEQQRVAIARAFVNRPAILLADEPTGNLDPITSRGIMNVLDRINTTGTTIVMATHDVALVDEIRRRVIELEDGKVIRDEAGGSYVTTTIPVIKVDDEPAGQPVVVVETGGADAKITVTTVVEASVDTESVLPEAVQAVEPMPVQAESVLPETVVPETVVPESVVPESVVPESVVSVAGARHDLDVQPEPPTSDPAAAALPDPAEAGSELPKTRRELRELRARELQLGQQRRDREAIEPQVTGVEAAAGQVGPPSQPEPSQAGQSQAGQSEAGQSQADHSGADHSGADHSGADHSGADHSGADHSGADHSGADHSGADHSGADQTQGDPEPAAGEPAAAEVPEPSRRRGFFRRR